MAHHTNQKSVSKDIFIFGRHPIELALQNKRRKVLEIYYVKECDLPAKALLGAVPTRSVARDYLDNLVGREALHQGLVARCKPLDQQPVDDLIKHLEKADSATVMILDQITDPHNIGAILRSAVAFDAAAVFVPESGAPEESGVLAKSASGALELIPFIRVANLARLMDKLKKAGFWCIGLDGYADKSIAATKLPQKSAFVMGSEGNGMRRLTQENCDYCVKLPINPAIESLNVSNAAALTLYEFRRQHPART